MTSIILPPTGLALPTHLADAAPQTAEDEAKDEKLASTLPRPVGWKILCAVPEASEKFDNSSLIKPDSVQHSEEIGTTVLFVLRMGPDAYKDKEKFPYGPWCQEGDFIIVRTYSGTRIKIFGKEFRLIYDDMVEAVVEDPRGITRVAI